MTITFNSRTKISLLISTVLILQTFTYPEFFFFSPFAYGVSSLSMLQLVSLTGWVLLISVPIIITLSEAPYNAFLRTLFLISAVLWPISLLAIRIVMLVNAQGLALEYLVNNPIFFFSDLIAPVIYLFMWKQLPRTSSKRSMKSFSVRTAEI